MSSSSSFEDAVQKKLKQAISARLGETRQHVEKELPEYIMSMITNKKAKSYMIKNLEAFMSDDTKNFCDWVFDLVEKINGPDAASSTQEIDTTTTSSDQGSALANLIKVAKEKDSLDMPSSSGTSSHDKDRSRTRDESTRKRKAEDEKPRKPIEAPRKDERNSKDGHRRDSHRRESDRERERERRDYRDDRRERRERNDRGDRKENGSERKRSGESSRHSRNEREKKPRAEPDIKEEPSDEGSPDRDRVVSKVVLNRPVESQRSLSSKVTVKRNARQMGDEKLMKARSKMFMTALQAASNSAEEPAPKTRILERTVVDTTNPDERTVVMVKLNMKEAPTRRMQETMQRSRGKKAADDANNKRKHDTIIWDRSDDDEEVRIEDDEEEIDKIVRESKESIMEDESDEPLSKKFASKLNFVNNKEEDADVANLKKKIRCNFWPKCTRGDKCLFIHPNAICAMFPKCTFGMKCHYVHPPCKFAERCTNKKCAYTHGDAEVIKMLGNYFPTTTLPRIEIKPVVLPDIPIHPAPIVNKTGVPCRFAERCTNPSCQFDHPKLCRFGDQCINERCTYFHPPAPIPAPAVKKYNRFKWTAPAAAPPAAGAATGTPVTPA